MTELSPVATAWRYQARGSSDGVIDAAKNVSAKASATGCNLSACP